MRAEKRAYHHRHKEDRHLKATDYYQKNKERLKAKSRKYHADHRFEVSVRARRYRDQNKDRLKEYYRGWRLSNRLSSVRSELKRRALKAKNAIGDVSAKALQARIDFYGNKCAYCDGPYQHIDHVIALARGGKHCPANLRPACVRCNTSKKDKPLSEWLAWRNKISRI